MDPEPDEIGPSDDHELYCNPENPLSLVMLKNVEKMKYLDLSSVEVDENGQHVFK